MKSPFFRDSQPPSNTNDDEYDEALETTERWMAFALACFAVGLVFVAFHL